MDDRAVETGVEVEASDEGITTLDAVADSSDDFRKLMQRKHEDRNKSTLVGFSDDDPPSSRRSNYHSRVLDHYSLPTPSSTVRFRAAQVHVYDSQGSQLIMEERLTTKNNTAVGKNTSLSLHGNGEQTNTTTNVTVKRVMNSSPGMHFLRGLYSVIAFLKGAFFFIFAVGLLLFLVSDLAHQAKEMVVHGSNAGKLCRVSRMLTFELLNTHSIHVYLLGLDIIYPLLATMISIGVFLHGLTQLMTLVTSFVLDVFAGKER